MKLKINVSYYPDLKGENLLGSRVTNGIITTIFFPEFKIDKIPRIYASALTKNVKVYDDIIRIIKEHEQNNFLITSSVVTEYTVICTGYPNTLKLYPTSKKRKRGDLKTILEEYIQYLFSGKDIDKYLWNRKDEDWEDGQSYMNIYSHYEQQYFWGDNPESTILEFYTEIAEDGIKKFLLSFINSDYLKSDLATLDANVVCTTHMALSAGITLKDILPQT